MFGLTESHVLERNKAQHSFVILLQLSWNNQTYIEYHVWSHLEPYDTQLFLGDSGEKLKNWIGYLQSYFPEKALRPMNTIHV